MACFRYHYLHHHHRHHRHQMRTGLSHIYAHPEMTVRANGRPQTPKITISHQLRVPMKIAMNENPPNPFYYHLRCYCRMQYGFGAAVAVTITKSVIVFAHLPARIYDYIT